MGLSFGLQPDDIQWVIHERGRLPDNRAQDLILEATRVPDPLPALGREKLEQARALLDEFLPTSSASALEVRSWDPNAVQAFLTDARSLVERIQQLDSDVEHPRIIEPSVMLRGLTDILQSKLDILAGRMGAGRTEISCEVQDTCEAFHRLVDFLLATKEEPFVVSGDLGSSIGAHWKPQPSDIVALAKESDHRDRAELMLRALAGADLMDERFKIRRFGDDLQIHAFGQSLSEAAFIKLASDRLQLDELARDFWSQTLRSTLPHRLSPAQRGLLFDEAMRVAKLLGLSRDNLGIVAVSTKNFADKGENGHPLEYSVGCLKFAEDALVPCTPHLIEHAQSLQERGLLDQQDVNVLVYMADPLASGPRKACTALLLNDYNLLGQGVSPWMFDSARGGILDDHSISIPSPESDRSLLYAIETKGLSLPDAVELLGKIKTDYLLQGKQPLETELFAGTDGQGRVPGIEIEGVTYFPMEKQGDGPGQSGLAALPDGTFRLVGSFPEGTRVISNQIARPSIELDGKEVTLGCSRDGLCIIPRSLS